MSIKLADTCKPMADFFVAEAEDIGVTIDGVAKSLQSAIDDEEIGADTSFTGTHSEWESLLPNEKAKYTTVYFTDDTNDVLIDDNIASTDKVYSSSKVEDRLNNDLSIYIKTNEEYAVDVTVNSGWTVQVLTASPISGYTCIGCIGFNIPEKMIPRISNTTLSVYNPTSSAIVGDYNATFLYKRNS